MSDPQKCILIVDDDESLCRQLGHIVQYFGYEPVLAFDASEALAQFKGRPIDLVLTDLHLPGELSGLDLLHDFRRARPRVPVIVLTGFPSEESIRETLIEGGYTYLAKPVQLEQLRVLIERALADSR